jgi:uncharacterized membrane protein
MQAEWLLQRNCSLSPRQAGAAYGALCALLLAIGLGFTLQGAWWVLAFALAGIGATVLALLHYARHACDRERIALCDDCLLVERIDAGSRHETRLDPCWLTIAAPARRRELVLLESRGVRIAIGGFVSAERRREVAHELRCAVRHRSQLSR